VGWDDGGRPAPCGEAVARLFADRVLVASGPTSRSADSYGHRFAAPGRPVAARRPGGRVRLGGRGASDWPGSAGGAGEQHEVVAGHVCALRERFPPGSSDRHPAIRVCGGAGGWPPPWTDEQGVPAPDAAGPASPAAPRTRPACDRGQSGSRDGGFLGRTATMAHRPNRIVRASAGRSRAPSDRRHHVDDGPRVLELRSWAASPLCARAAEVRTGPARPRAAAGATG
jgi:hypothetical protein